MLDGSFPVCCQSLDVLERLDPDPEYWEGKRGACVGVFQLVIAGKCSRDDLQDVLTMVRNTSNPQVHDNVMKSIFARLFVYYFNILFSYCVLLLIRRWSTLSVLSRNGAKKIMSKLRKFDD